MKLQLASHSDIGTHKPDNEDSAGFLEALTPAGVVGFAAVADGVGGLSQGELASADMIRAFSRWFEEEALLAYDDAGFSGAHNDFFDAVKGRWSEIIQERNRKIKAYGEKKNVSLGTTFTALYLTPDAKFLICHIGDSRIVQINDHAKVLTEDHTVAAQAARDGKISAEELRSAPGHNVLTQCIGASPNPVPDYVTGVVKNNDVFLICTDGLHRRVSLEELQQTFKPAELVNESTMKKKLVEITEACKRRGEKDNITSVLVKVCG